MIYPFYLRDCLTTRSSLIHCELIRVCLAYLINLRGFLRKNREVSLKLLGERKGSKLAIVRTSSFTAVKFCYMFCFVESHHF